MGIKLKVTLWYSLLMTALCAFALVLVNGYMARSGRDSLENALEQAVALGAANAECDGGNYEIDDADDIAQIFPEVALYLYDGDGELLFGRRERLVSPFSEGGIREEARSDGTALLVLDEALSLGGREMYVRGVTVKRYADTNVAPLRLISLVVFPLLVVLAAFGGYILTRRAFRPVAMITDAARGITRSRDFSMRIAARGPNDEMHALANTIDDMLGELEDAYEAERRLTADASHELRTPLAGIMLQCENALAADDIAQKDEALRQIEKGGRGMSALLTKLLLLARIDANPRALEIESLDLSELVESCVQERLLGETRGASIVTEIERDIRCEGDQSLLMRLVMNLLDNALRYGREGGNVLVSLRTEGGEAALTVADDGPGISEEALAHVFERFYRADEAHSGGGTGLGLALVKTIANRHGARVSVTSDPGVKTAFSVYFPAARSV